MLDKLYDDTDNVITMLKNQDEYYEQFRNTITNMLKEHLEMTLYEKDEVKSPKTDVAYHVLTAKDDNTKKLFSLYLILFAFEAKVRNKTLTDNQKIVHVGIDYEFKNREIALMQINFESPTNSYIWLLNPAELSPKDTDILIKHLMINKRIYKILHGADSLDIPYIYNTLFKGDKQLCVNFTKKLYDTRFLCEYFRLSKNEERKCSIYDALKYFGTVNDAKIAELEQITEMMGPVQDIMWNVHKLSSYHFKYALYDVLFLQHFIYDIFRKIVVETPQYKHSYRYTNEITRFVLLERREILNVTEKVSSEINSINNYLIVKDGQNLTLITVYNNFINNLTVKDGDNQIDINFILLVPFLKKTAVILLKSVVYSNIFNKYKVYKKKNQLAEDTLTTHVNNMLLELKTLGFKKILHLLELLKDY